MEEFPRRLLREALEIAITKTLKLTDSNTHVFRTTIDATSAAGQVLKQIGFLAARSVLVLNIDVDELLEFDLESSSPYVNMRMVPMRKAVTMLSNAELANAWIQVYSQSARLDPATPELLGTKELISISLGDPDLDRDASIAAFVGDRLVGICPVYNVGLPDEVELGVVGSIEKSADFDSAISLALLRAVAERVKPRGIRHLIAEVDTDSWYAVHTFARIPGKVGEELTSYMYVPRWRQSD